MTRHGLVGKFALLSALAVALLGVGLARLEGGLIRNRALESARNSAQLVAQVALQSHLTPSDLQSGLSAETVKSLDQSLQEGTADDTIARAKIWSPQGKVVYSDDHSLIDRTFPMAQDLREALEGNPSADVSSLNEAENVDERRFGQLLEVYLPLRFDQHKPAGAFELYLPYRPVAAGIAADTRRLYLLTLGGLLLLYLLLFRIVYGASKRIDRQQVSLNARAEENERLALTDQLTGLPNRILFTRLLAERIDDAKAGAGAVSVVLMDLDRFKDVNDTLGHDVGDQLLMEVGARLARVARENEQPARLGGDEFAVLVPGDRGPAEEVASRLLAQFVEPFQVEGMAIEVAPSIGIANYPRDGEGGRVILRRADIAMYRAKESTSRIEVFSPEFEDYTPDRLQLAGELRRAIEQDQLLLHCQPKIDLLTGSVVGVEALVRWQHPDRGLIFPDQFIPLAERTGIIRQLTTWVLDEALLVCRRAMDRGLRLPIAVNLSARNLLDNRLVDQVEALLAANHVEPELLILEVTESSMVEEASHVQASLHALEEMGVVLSIDDFGTGYSSLAYLQRLPVRELKIDRSFVRRLGEESGSVPIVRAAVDLGRALDLLVVAEGVETEMAATILRTLGCHSAQGFYFAPPMPEEDLFAWLTFPVPGTLGAAAS
jgi:diguanylate cyclase (GGDEF)-like protein